MLKRNLIFFITLIALSSIGMNISKWSHAFAAPLETEPCSKNADGTLPEGCTCMNEKDDCIAQCSDANEESPKYPELTGNPCFSYQELNPPPLLNQLFKKFGKCDHKKATQLYKDCVKEKREDCYNPDDKKSTFDRDCPSALKIFKECRKRESFCQSSNSYYVKRDEKDEKIVEEKVFCKKLSNKEECFRIKH